MPDQAVIDAWVSPGLLLERYRYAPGPAGALPLHDHDVYQLGFSPDFPGEYRYRRARHDVPVGALSVIHPGEPHAARDVTARERPVTFPMMYVDPERVRQAVAPLHRSDREGQAPYFAAAVVVDRVLAGLYRRCYGAAIAGDGFARDSLLLRLLAEWFRRCGEHPSGERPVPRAPAHVRRARDYLHAHAHGAVSLAQLADVAGFSPYHLLRVFKAETGMSPHRYLTQLRVWRAARLLAAGRPISETALAVGFADQSHLTRHFKRHTGVTPGRYRPRSEP